MLPLGGARVVGEDETGAGGAARPATPDDVPFRAVNRDWKKLC